MTALLLFVPALARSETTPTAAETEFFEQKIRPILVDQCYRCHSGEAKNLKGGLRLDTKEFLLKGGDSGPALAPGDPEKSLLIKAVRYTDENLQMPPKGKKLAAEQIAALEAWVKMGAPDPRTGAGIKAAAETIAEKAAQHWAFQPVKNSPVPPVKNKKWVQTPVDAFILAKLEAAGLKPSPRADKRTLLRRVTFDLTGLPPTAEEMEAFEKDRSADAFPKVVDRLLASPRYGERWARHWLDVARYADTKGYLAGNQERRFPYSYTYRDYVIRAFNEDVPYDAFLRQQIAADQLDLKDDKKPLAGLGFITLGRSFLGNQNDIIDDRIDVVMRGTQGLTVACARCHDHKYDPIPTKDYYSLYGVFASSHEPEDKPLLGIQPPADQFDAYTKEKKRRADAAQSYRDKRSEEILSDHRQKTGKYLLMTWQLAQLEDKSKSEAATREKSLDPVLAQRWVTSLTTWAQPTNAIFAPWAAFAALPETNFAAGAETVRAQILTNTALNPLVVALFTSNAPPTLEQASQRYGQLFTDTEKAWETLLAEKAKENLPAPTALTDTNREAIRQIMYVAGGPYEISDGAEERLFDVPSIQQLRELRRQVAEIDAIHAGAPPRGMVLADNATPMTPRVFIRGNAGNPGAEVPRQFLEILSGTNRQPFQKGSGRLELAEAITTKTNPLTARVFVNRVWQHHVGKPFVSTPSDFGLRSDPPTHPELLDWLAWQFMENGWSMKKLHRLILLSATYQQESDETPDGLKLDPANNLVWRMNRQRLEFEAMRDSLLQVSGRLDPKEGGLAVDIVEAPFSGRRSIYGYIDRQNLPGLFRTFDFANPDTTSPQRFNTTVPQQALFLLNSPFVVEQARSLLTNLPALSKPDDEAARIRALYERVYQREPEREELAQARYYLQAHRQLAPGPINASPWQYGYGEVDEKTERVKKFQPLPVFTGKQWQASAAFPDPTLAYTMLSIEGGHPGNHLSQAAIRRWVAPFDGTIKISGTLNHIFNQGDGVRGRIVSSRSGELGKWTAFNRQTKPSVSRCPVQKGDTIDFVVDAQGSPLHDTFKWTVVIKTTDVKYGQPPLAVSDWNSVRDFAGPPQDTRPLTAWEKLAQVMLVSNEFIFVD